MHNCQKHKGRAGEGKGTSVRLFEKGQKQAPNCNPITMLITLKIMSYSIGFKFHNSFSTNEKQIQNLLPAIFRAPLASYRQLLKIMIGLSRCLFPRWFVPVIKYLGICFSTVLWNCSILRTRNSLSWVHFCQLSQFTCSTAPSASRMVHLSLSSLFAG